MWYLFDTFFVSFLILFLPRVSAIIKNRFLKWWLISRLAVLWILSKKEKKYFKGPTRSRSVLPNKRPRGFRSISLMRLMTTNVDEDDCNKCRWFTGSLDKGYHHTELMVYTRQRAADISDSEAFKVNTERVRWGGRTFCSNEVLTNSEHADRATDETVLLF